MSVPPAQTPRPRARVGRGRPPVPGTEQRILDTTLAMLAESSYAALRLDQLARRAGVGSTRRVNCAVHGSPRHSVHAVWAASAV